jgi:WhiB family redox-sensing transcriptional regulator
MGTRRRTAPHTVDVGRARMTVATTPVWFRDANCRGEDPGIFFPSSGEPAQHAYRICAQCRHEERCLEYALEHHVEFGQYGIWGGTSENERRRIRRRRNRRTA